MARHSASCDAYLSLYRTDRARALDPQAEWERYHSDDEVAEREAEKEERFAEKREAFRALSDARSADARERWKRGSAGVSSRAQLPAGAAPLRCAQSAEVMGDVAGVVQ